MDAENILNKALRQHKPSTIICSFSGGYDSMVATHLTLRWSRLFAHSANVVTIAVDTLISADGWREFVTDAARTIGAHRFQIRDNAMLDKWKEDVKTRGFVYRKAQHKIYFYYLKQNVFRAVLQHYKRHRHDRVMFINGVRRAESTDRANTPEIEVIGSGVYVNPLVYWSDEQIHQYRIAHELPINPFYDRFGNSGDCLCNWHNRISMTALENHAPKAAEVIRPLDEQNRLDFGYGYDQEPARWRLQESRGQLPLFEWNVNDTPNLCAGCTKPKASNDNTDFVALQRMAW